MKSLSVIVPATSANLGPGFDTLGLALNLVDTLRVDFTEDAPDVVLAEVRGETATKLDQKDNLLCHAYRRWGEEQGTALPGARFSLESTIPVGKGFGSSAASIVAGLAAAAHAAGEKEPRDRVLQLAVHIEGHADNVAAAVLGGMTVAFRENSRVHALNVANHLALGIALFVPDEMLKTSEARAVLPRSVPMEDAVFDLGRLAFLTTALIWGRWDRIGPAMQDRLHQPHRARVVPALDDVIAAALAAGAYGASLSGGGPSVIALTPREGAETVAAAMEECADTRGWKGHRVVTSMREEGVQVKEIE